MKNFIERLEDFKRPFSRSDNYGNGIIDAVNESILLYNELHPQPETIAPEPNKQLTERSFKVRVTGCSGEFWYKNKIGETFEVKNYNGTNFNVVKNGKELCELLSKSDCEIIPETQIIPFDYQRWKDGDYVRVVTRDGREVKQLTKFECKDEYPLIGVLGNKRENWTINGGYCPNISATEKDLHLEIAKPQPKQVTTYHWIDSTGYVRGSYDIEKAKRLRMDLIGETITEQQENGEWKIVKTTLK